MKTKIMNRSKRWLRPRIGRLSCLSAERDIHGGFTLVELLIVSAIGATVIVAALTTIVPHIRTSSNQLVIRSLQDEWGFLSYFIDTEISEMSCASVSGSTLSLYNNFSCSGAALITYSHSVSTLTRTGPSILDNGSLATGAASVSTTLSENVAAFAPSTTAAPASSRQPSYSITLSGLGLTFTGLSSSTRMRTSNF